MFSESERPPAVGVVREDASARSGDSGVQDLPEEDRRQHADTDTAKAGLGRSRAEAPITASSAEQTPSAQPYSDARAVGLGVDALLQSRVPISLRANSDVPAESDGLGFETYVRAVAAFLVSGQTTPPLTLSIEGEWGTGKSSFLTQLRGRIRADNPAGTLCIQRNPWRYRQNEEMWSSFAVAFIQQASRQLRPGQRLRAKVSLFVRRLWRPEDRLGLIWRIALLVGYALAVGALSLLLVRAGPTWMTALSESAGKVSGVLGKLLRTGGWVTATSLAVLLVAVSWKYVRRLLTLDTRAYLSVPDYVSRVPFVQRFHEDFELVLKTYVRKRRAFVFVDDVDRCEPPQAADLMRALNLLIPGNQQLVFVLGVDRAKAAAGIAATYKDLLPYLAAEEGPMMATGPETAPQAGLSGLEFGHRFVEKFVQIPFAVPAPARSDLENYINRLAGQPPIAIQARNENVSTQTRDASAARPSSGQRAGTELRFEALMIQVDTVDSSTIRQIALMMSAPLGRNPRRIKQFLNLLRLRAHIGHATGLFDQIPGETMWALPQLGKLIALELLVPGVLPYLDRDPLLLQSLEDCAVHGVLDDSHSAGLARWLAAHPQVGELLRLGLLDDEWRERFPNGQCSLRDLDLTRALRTAPRIRGFPERGLEERVGRVVSAEARISASADVQAEAQSVHIGDSGTATEAVSVRKSSTPEEGMVPSEETPEAPE